MSYRFCILLYCKDSFAEENTDGYHISSNKHHTPPQMNAPLKEMPPQIFIFFK